MANCPHCGAVPMEDRRYRFICGSIQGHKRESRYQSDKCRIRELEQRNVKLESMAAKARVHVKMSSHEDDCPCIGGDINNLSDDRCLCGYDELKEALNALDKEPGDE